MQNRSCLRQRGRKPAKTLAEYKYENKRLKDGKRAVAGFSAIHRKEVRPRAKYAVIHRHRDGISSIRYVPILSVYPEADTMILSIRTGQAGKGRGSGGNRSRQQQERSFHTHTATAGCGWCWRSQRHPSQSQDHPAYHGKIRVCLSEIRRRRKWVNHGAAGT